MNKKNLLLLFIAVLFAVGVVYIQHREQKKMETNFNEMVQRATSSAGQDTVLDSLKYVEVCSDDTIASPRHYNSFAEAFNAYSELANSDDLRIAVRFNLDSDQDPTAFMEELKKHSGDTEWIEKYCKENNISVVYTIVPTK